MFQLDKAEAEALRSQIATSNDGRGGRRYVRVTDKSIQLVCRAARMAELADKTTPLESIAAPAVEKGILVVRATDLALGPAGL